MSQVASAKHSRSTQRTYMRWGFWGRRGIQYGFLIFMSAIILGPVLTAVLGGLKTTGELFAQPFGIPANPQWQQYIDIVTSQYFWTLIKNSLIIVIGTSLGVVVCSTLLGFVFARVEFRGRTLLFTFISLGLLFPVTVAFLPVFIQVRNMGLTDNHFGIILPLIAFGLPASTIILRTFFRSVPGELEDAAYIDGCSTFGFFRYILLPLARPAIAAVLVLQAIVAWNEYFLPLLVLTNDQLWPVTLGLMQFRGQYSTDWGRIMAYVTLLIVPAVLFYAVTQRYIVTGLTGGELKG